MFILKISLLNLLNKINIVLASFIANVLHKIIVALSCLYTKGGSYDLNNYHQLRHGGIQHSFAVMSHQNLLYLIESEQQK